ncbi:MAG TPA: hypothetical protein VHZ51_31805 [Ktedonobacteraceae bacterium]|nr:hypothetical protein [Ktedonobacteraceae bacterium]
MTLPGRGYTGGEHPRPLFPRLSSAARGIQGRITVSIALYDERT